MHMSNKFIFASFDIIAEVLFVSYSLFTDSWMGFYESEFFYGIKADFSGIFLASKVKLKVPKLFLKKSPIKTTC